MKNMNVIEKLFVAAMAIALVNCSGVNFNQGKNNGDSGTAQNAGGPGNDASGNIPQNGGTSGGPPVTGGPGGTTNPINIPPGFPPPPPGSTDAPPAAPPGSTFPPGTPSVPAGTITPRVTRDEPPCQRLAWCEYGLHLDKAYSMVVDFNWRTNDDMSRQITIPAGFIRAVPNTHYVPGSGHVRFLPGETVRKIYVLNINPDPTIQIVIPFIFSACQYGSVGLTCSSIFY